jgi:hypothetical protein
VRVAKAVRVAKVVVTARGPRRTKAATATTLLANQILFVRTSRHGAAQWQFSTPLSILFQCTYAGPADKINEMLINKAGREGGQQENATCRSASAGVDGSSGVTQKLTKNFW